MLRIMITSSVSCRRLVSLATFAIFVSGSSILLGRNSADDLPHL